MHKERGGSEDLSRLKMLEGFSKTNLAVWAGEGRGKGAVSN